MVEPTVAESATFTNIGEILVWSGLRGDPADVDSESGSILNLFGAATADHHRVLGILSEADWNLVITQWRIAQQPPTPAQGAKAALLGRACRVSVGTQLRVEDLRIEAQAQLAAQAAAHLAQATAVVAAPAVAGKSIKLSQVVDQTSDEEARMLDQVAIRAAYARYDARLGGSPPPDHEPTYEQLSAMSHLNALDGCPYVDFAIFGPHAVRIIRKLKLTGMCLNANGELFRSELSGPTSYEQWETCYMVFRTACIMLDIVTPAALDQYKDHIKQYSLRYQHVCWALLYQADTRARRELCERIRRTGMALFDSLAAGVPPGQPVVCEYNPNRPWEYVFRKLTQEFSFWKKELEDPAMLILTHAVRHSDSAVTGESPIASRAQEHIADVASMHGMGKNTQSSSQSPKKKMARPAERQFNFDESGANTTNRRGLQLCPGFQTGACTGRTCPSDAGAHQCSVCLQPTHGAKDHSSSSGKGGKGGKGKGGKGKGGKNKGKGQG
jgi:hypothetical protein